jgi:uncharacterized membrane protein
MELDTVQTNQNVPSEGPVTKVNVGRLTNCIFAFTLLYLFKNISLPTIFEADTTGYLTTYLVQVVPELENYTNAFLLIAIIWILTFHILHRIKKVNHTFLYLHFCMLMTLVFIPVSSMLADNFPYEPMFSLLLHLNVFCTGMFLFWEWRYVSGNGGLTHGIMTGREKGESLRRILYLIAAAFTGACLAYSDYNGTRFVYLLVLLVLLTDFLILSGRAKKQDQFLKRTGTVQAGAGVRSDETGGNPGVHSLPVTVKTGSPSHQEPVELGMLEILVNGVFGFILTLIVKNIPLPKVTDVQNMDFMFRFFIRILTDAVEFVLVFVILILIWLLLFQMFRWMKSLDLFFVCLTLAEMLIISFIPITSSLFTFFADQPHIVTFFCLNILLSTLILLCQWYHLSRSPELLQEEADQELKKDGLRTWPAAFIAAIWEGRKNFSFVETRNRMVILPAGLFLWLILDLGAVPLSFAPAFVSLCYLIFRSWDV